MRALCYSLVLLTVACSESPSSSDGDAGPDHLPGGGDGVGSAEPTGEPTGPTGPTGPTSEEGSLRIATDFANGSCTTRRLSFELIEVTDAQGAPVTNAQCTWTFDDGQTSSLCAGDVTFADAGDHSYCVRVIDPLTQLEGEQCGNARVAEPLSIDVLAEVHSCNMTFALTTTVTPPTFSVTEIRPADRVVGDSLIFGPVTKRVIQVTAPGIYEIDFNAEDERSDGPICTSRKTITVNVPDCHAGSCEAAHPNQPE